MPSLLLCECAKSGKELMETVELLAVFVFLYVLWKL